jgi:cystathionine beta-lyase/cystathionine gamma-synthase
MHSATKYLAGHSDVMAGALRGGRYSCISNPLTDSFSLMHFTVAMEKIADF